MQIIANKAPLPLGPGQLRSAAYQSLGVVLSNDASYVSQNYRPGTAMLANEALIVQSTYIEELTSWAIGYGSQVGNTLRALRDFMLPPRPSNTRTVRLTVWDENEPWATIDPTRVKRTILGDFLEVRQRTATKADRLILNRGLSCVLDQDELKERPQLQQLHTKWLIDLLMRASVLEAVTIYQAASSVLNVTWDGASNPDLDVKNEIITLANVTGFHANRGVYGDTASLKRQTAYEIQLTAGSLSHSMMMTDEKIAEATGLQEVMTNADRYQATATTKSEIIGSNVYLFTAIDGESVEDASNVVRHVANASYGGGEYAVYVTPLGPKKVVLSVENYELIQTQHTTGIAQIAIK